MVQFGAEDLREGELKRAGFDLWVSLLAFAGGSTPGRTSHQEDERIAKYGRRKQPLHWASPLVSGCTGFRPVQSWWADRPTR